MKILILGAGAVVQHYYLPVLANTMPDCAITVLDLSDRTLADIQTQYPQIGLVQQSAASYLKEVGSFDAVVVALPNFLHAEAAQEALNAGIPVLCEKPLAMTAQDCCDLYELSQKKRVPLSINMVRRRLPSVVALSEMLKLDAIGNVQSVDWQMGEPHAWLSDTGSYFDKRSGGVLTDLGVHYLDILQQLLGVLTPTTYADDYCGGTEANCLFELKTASNCQIKMKLSRTQKLRNTAVFMGEKGSLILEKNNDAQCLWQSKAENPLLGEIYPAIETRTNVANSGCLENAFYEQLKDFFSEVKGQPKRAGSAREAAETMRLIEWAYTQRRNDQNAKRSWPGRGGGYSNLENLMPKKTCVTGATGFIGTRLLNRLSAMGFTDFVTPVRNFRTCAEIARFDTQMPNINLLDFMQVKKVMCDAKYVFHLAYGRDGRQAEKVTIEGTKNVVRAAIENGAEAIVILSTGYVFGLSHDPHIINESCPYKPYGGGYGRSKAIMERFCLEQAKKQKQTRIVVLNPTCVYGPGGKAYSLLPYQLARENAFCWIDGGIGLVNYTYVENLIDAILLAAMNVDAHGERFIISDGYCAWREFLDPVINGIGSTPSYSKAELRSMQRKNAIGWIDVWHELVKNRVLIDKLKTLPGVKIIGRGIKSVIKSARRDGDAAMNCAALDQTTNTQSLGGVPPMWLADLFASTQSIFVADKAKRLLGWEPRIRLGEGQQKTKEWLEEVIF